jgi:hypothetical protein
MVKIEVDASLSKKLRYELTRIKKDIENIRKINRALRKINVELKSKNEKLSKLNQRNKAIIGLKNKAIDELKLRVKTALESTKKSNEILVEIKEPMALLIYEHSNFEVFILNDDGSETLLTPQICKELGDKIHQKRFAIEAKTITEKN